MPGTIRSLLGGRAAGHPQRRPVHRATTSTSRTSSRPTSRSANAADDADDVRRRRSTSVPSRGVGDRHRAGNRSDHGPAGPRADHPEPGEVAEIRDQYSRCQRGARDQLGWRPRFTLREGLERTVSRGTRPSCDGPRWSPRRRDDVQRDTGIAGAWVIDQEPREDERGFFARMWCEEVFAARGLVARSCSATTRSAATAGRCAACTTRRRRTARSSWCAACAARSSTSSSTCVTTRPPGCAGSASS